MQRGVVTIWQVATRYDYGGREARWACVVCPVILMEKFGWPVLVLGWEHCETQCLWWWERVCPPPLSPTSPSSELDGYKMLISFQFQEQSDVSYIDLLIVWFGLTQVVGEAWGFCRAPPGQLAWRGPAVIHTWWCNALVQHPPPWVWAGPTHLLLINRVWKKLQDVTFEIRSQKGCGFCLEPRLLVFLLLTPTGGRCHVVNWPMERPMWKKTEGGSSQQPMRELRPSVWHPMWNWILPTTMLVSAEANPPSPSRAFRWDHSPEQ